LTVSIKAWIIILKLVFNFGFIFHNPLEEVPPMQSGQSEIDAQSEDSPLEKFEVAIESSGLIDQVVIKYFTWTEGLGWCAQKTLRVDSDQIDDLHRALTIARHRVNARRADRGEAVVPAKVIKLPAVA
jgi:hypothetical protein